MSILDRLFRALGLLAGIDLDTQQAVARCEQKLDQILSILLEEPPIAGAVIHLFSGEINVKALTKHSKATAKVDFQLLDNGTATGTISFVDSVGEPTAPVPGATVSTTATSSDPGVTVSVDGTGLVLTVAVASPLPNPLPTGVVLTAAIVITNPDGTTINITATSDPIDVVPGGPAGASISLA